MLDVGDGTAAVAGDDHQVELDELASLLFEERADPASRREGLADARAAQVTHRAPDVDPQTERHVTVEGAVGLVEEEARMDEAARAAIEPERVPDLLELLAGARIVVRGDRSAEGGEAIEVGAWRGGARGRRRPRPPGSQVCGQRRACPDPRR